MAARPCLCDKQAVRPRKVGDRTEMRSRRTRAGRRIEHLLGAHQSSQHEAAAHCAPPQQTRACARVTRHLNLIPWA